MRVVLLGGLLALAGAPALAESYDASVRRLCTSTRQQACWVKATASLCPPDGSPCFDLEDRAPARVIRKEGRRWLVETAQGTGWVHERFMLIDSSR